MNDSSQRYETDCEGVHGRDQPEQVVGGLSEFGKRVGLFGNQSLTKADGDQNIASLEQVSCVVLQLQGEWE